MKELSIEALQSIKADMERRRANKQAEIDQMPQGVRSSAISTDIAYLRMDIERLNRSIEDIEEYIAGKQNKWVNISDSQRTTLRVKLSA